MILSRLMRHLDGRASAVEIGLWVILSEYRNAETGLCCPTQEELATVARLARPTVRKILRRGRELGLYMIIEEYNPETHRKYHRYQWLDDLFTPWMENPLPPEMACSSEGKNETLKPITHSHLVEEEQELIEDVRESHGFGVADFPPGENGLAPAPPRNSFRAIREKIEAGLL